MKDLIKILKAEYKENKQIIEAGTEAGYYTENGINELKETNKQIKKQIFSLFQSKF